MKKVKLSAFIENPDNPQTVTDEAFDRLIGKLKRVPTGLTAKRIAYVTDDPSGKFMVISGNKRLRALKAIYGEDGEVESDYFQDVTFMSTDQRREFIIAENICEGKWVAEMLLALLPKDQLRELMDERDVLEILADIPSDQQLADNQEFDEGEFADEIYLKLKLSSDDRIKALKVLDAIDPDDHGKALMTLIKKAKK